MAAQTHTPAVLSITADQSRHLVWNHRAGTYVNAFAHNHALRQLYTDDRGLPDIMSANSTGIEVMQQQRVCL